MSWQQTDSIINMHRAPSAFSREENEPYHMYVDIDLIVINIYVYQLQIYSSIQLCFKIWILLASSFLALGIRGAQLE